MTCPQVHAKLLLYLASELEPSEDAAVTAHLHSCPACMAEAAALGEGQERVEGVVRTAVAAPASLDARVLEKVRSFGPPRSRWRPFSPPWSLRRRMAAAAAAAVLLVGGYLTGQWHAERSPGRGAAANPPGADAPWARARVTLSLTLLGDDHRKYLADPYPAEVPGPDAREVAVGLTPLLPFPVAEVDLRSEGAQLLGGRKCQAHGVPIAFLLYDWNGERVSLYQLDGRKLALPPLRTVRFQGRRFLTGEADGLSYVAWQSGAMSFVMVSGTRPEHLLHLACSASGISRPRGA